MPEFTAVDQVERRGRSLDQLSSGTRVQLLLAVRIAFVEQQEQGVKLPLLLDEVLGNSDDERARAIMEAVVELSREGRQIFYFTAQMDEVARWRALFAEDARYHEMPFDEPKAGRVGIRDYWTMVTADQRNIDFKSQVIAVNGGLC